MHRIEFWGLLFAGVISRQSLWLLAKNIVTLVNYFSVSLCGVARFPCHVLEFEYIRDQHHWQGNNGVGLPAKMKKLHHLFTKRDPCALRILSVGVNPPIHDHSFINSSSNDSRWCHNYIVSE